MFRKARAFQNQGSQLNVKTEDAAQASDTVTGKLEGPLTRQGLWALQREPGRSRQVEGLVSQRPITVPSRRSSMASRSTVPRSAAR